ncbi:hypothetical protein ACFX19_021804 [Malus domestica]
METILLAKASIGSVPRIQVGVGLISFRWNI